MFADQCLYVYNSLN